MTSETNLVIDFNSINLENVPCSSGRFGPPFKFHSLTPILRDKVFGNDLIRDKIFDYVFCSHYSTNHVNKLPIENYLACRLVNHIWFDYATHRLKATKIPIFTLNFRYWRGSTMYQKRYQRPCQVQKFLETWATAPDANNRIPLFNLALHPPDGQYPSSGVGVIQKDQVQDLLKCLIKCGNGLYQLLLTLSNQSFITDDEAVPIVPLCLPNLVILNVLLLSLESSPLAIMLLPLIFSGCKRLTCLYIQGNFANCQAPLTRLFSKYGRPEKLPKTLVKIRIELFMTPQLLENLFLENSLPYLSKLLLYTWQGLDNNDVISRILDRFSLQLKYLFIQNFYQNEVIEGEDEETDLSLSLIRFSVMTKLTEMSVYSFHSELGTGMEQSFPVLETLTLDNQTSSMMEKWTYQFQYNCVKDLSVKMCTEFYDDNAFTLTLSQQLHVAFTYLQKLDFTFGGWVEDDSIRNIFQHLTHLRQLFIRLKNTQAIWGPSTWDAFLLGVSPEFARELATSLLNQWDSIDLNHHRNPAHSILNLTCLSTFYLDGYNTGTRRMDDQLISSVSFQFAFLRMPNLESLRLLGDFRVSDTLMEEWHRQRRNLYI